MRTVAAVAAAAELGAGIDDDGDGVAVADVGKLKETLWKCFQRSFWMWGLGHIHRYCYCCW